MAPPPAIFAAIAALYFYRKEVPDQRVQATVWHQDLQPILLTNRPFPRLAKMARTLIRTFAVLDGSQFRHRLQFRRCLTYTLERHLQIFQRGGRGLREGGGGTESKAFPITHSIASNLEIVII
jgi:hypothetical protein